MRSDKAFLEKATEEEVRAWQERSRTRWKEGLEKFSKYSDFVS